MQPLRKKHVSLDAPVQRHESESGGTNLVGQCRNAERHAFTSKPLGLAVKRLVLSVLLEQQHRQEAGPAQPRGTTWNGAGGWVIFSQSRHANFSRAVWTTFHALGITSSVSVMSSLSFDRRVLPQASQEHGAGTAMRSRGRCSGKGFLTALTLKGYNARRFGRSGFRSEIVLAGVRPEVGELDSICSRRRRLRSALGPNCSRRSFAICSLRWAMIASMALSRASAWTARASASSARSRTTASSAFSASMSSGKDEMAASMSVMESQNAAQMKRKLPYPALCGRQRY